MLLGPLRLTQPDFAGGRSHAMRLQLTYLLVVEKQGFAQAK
ncbi:MAG TPA: hypothetical protein VE963_18620 [Reyranella sp.]|nr:hypothetical protein [Reyranella sp.]